MKKPPAGADAKNVLKQWKIVGFSCLVGIGAAFLLLCAFALILSVKDLPHGAITPMAIAAVVVGCFVAGYCAGRTIRAGGLVYGLLCGTVIFLFAFFCELMLIGGGFSILLLYKYIIYISSGMIGGVLGVNKRRKVR